MKKVEAIFRHIMLDDVKLALDKIGAKGMTVTDVKGAGKQRGYTEVYRGSKLTISLRPKVKVELVVSDDLVEEVISTIAGTARTGEIGDGKIFISDITEAVAIRTGVRGEPAIN